MNLVRGGLSGFSFSDLGRFEVSESFVMRSQPLHRDPDNSNLICLFHVLLSDGSGKKNREGGAKHSFIPLNVGVLSSWS